ncbi:alpha/beta hydrolase [Malaciobacter mytili]|uniref:alpha/beta hydrolase n=1 Tax=Malaciobacter mytili TaxID=603050 RepID=UPI0013E96D4E|nr:alpha/beta hydrolase [Malaciobacter mytili]
MKIIFLLFICTILYSNDYKNKEVLLNSKLFQIYTIQKDLNQCKNKSLNVYIEGDGISWETKHIISKNPTPKIPTSLNLMKTLNQKCAIYLARPCQFINGKNCISKYWTSHRYSYSIIQSYNEILDDLKNIYKIKNFNLTGYSGGGVIATLITTQRDDINYLVTIASNLDIDKWTSYHKISKLYGSLNPSNYTFKLKDISQYHLIGSKDTIVPFEIFQSYYKRFDKKDKINFYLYKNNHFSNWEISYKDFYNLSFSK